MSAGSPPTALCHTHASVCSAMFGEAGRRRPHLRELCCALGRGLPARPRKKSVAGRSNQPTDPRVSVLSRAPAVHLPTCNL
eukprot:3306469-Alexandrium_andersonii.AAC.1